LFGFAALWFVVKKQTPIKHPIATAAHKRKDGG